MPRQHGSNITALTWNATSILADAYNINFAPSAELHDTTTFGDDWREQTAGLKDGGEVALEMLYNDTATTGTYELFFNDLGVARTLSFTDGTNTWSMTAVCTNVPLTVSVGDMMRLSVTVRVSGAVTVT